MTTKITTTSKNTNCLEGMKCPKCAQEESLKIEATCLFTVTDDGTEDDGDGREWSDTNYCECTECGHRGIVTDFTIEKWDTDTSAKPTLQELYKAMCAAHDKLSDALEDESNDDEHDAAVDLCVALNDFHAAYTNH
jgi:hypothetical protein